MARGGLTGSMLDGRYRIGSVIAKGGMSTVYRGLDTRLDRPVAVKVMAAQYSNDAAFVTRFSREARLAAGLSHPGIVAVYDHGRDGDHAFLVMELVDGGTLRDLLHQQGAQSVAVTAAVIGPLLEALAVAHRAGLVHRDVKPENILINSRGQIKVADFGLVRAVTSQTMATGDVILGTVAYLSPEQVETGASDPRSDVYSAAIVAWELLAGEPPFTGDNAMSVAYQHVHSDVPLIGDVAAEVPALFEDLLADATARDPQHRPRDAGAFAARLASVCDRTGIDVVDVPVPAGRQPAPAPHPSAPSSSDSGDARPDESDDGSVQTAEPGRTAVVAHQQPAGSDIGTTPRGRGPRGTEVVRSDGRPATARTPRDAHPSPTAPPARTKRRRWPRRLIWILVMVLLGAAAAAGGWWLGDGRWAYAPTTIGLTQPDAERAVRQAGLIPQVAVSMDDMAPVGTVATAQPKAGARLLRGSAIDLVVSSGRPQVPTITAGSSVEQAERRLVDVGLRHAKSDDWDYDEAVPQGAVIGTDPAAGTRVRIGASVALVKSLGPQRILVPQVAGKSAEDATNKLIVAGFDVGDPVAGFDADSPDGSVLGTEPAAGQRIPASNHLHLVLNSSVTVPDLRGRSLQTATRSLESDGYRVIVGDARFDAGIDGGAVVGTEPAAGTRMDPESPAITLFPSNAVRVPDITSGNLGEARKALTDAGFTMHTGGLFTFDSSPVIGQSPDGDTLAEPGSAIWVTTF